MENNILILNYNSFYRLMVKWSWDSLASDCFIPHSRHYNKVNNYPYKNFNFK